MREVEHAAGMQGIRNCTYFVRKSQCEVQFSYLLVYMGQKLPFKAYRLYYVPLHLTLSSMHFPTHYIYEFCMIPTTDRDLVTYRDVRLVEKLIFLLYELLINLIQL